MEKRHREGQTDRKKIGNFFFIFFFAAGPVRRKGQHENLCGTLLADMLTEHLIKHV